MLSLYSFCTITSCHHIRHGKHQQKLAGKRPMSSIHTVYTIQNIIPSYIWIQYFRMLTLNPGPTETGFTMINFFLKDDLYHRCHNAMTGRQPGRYRHEYCINFFW